MCIKKHNSFLLTLYLSEMRTVILTNELLVMVSGYWLIQSLVLSVSGLLRKTRDACTLHALLRVNLSSAGTHSLFLCTFYIFSTCKSKMMPTPTCLGLKSLVVAVVANPKWYLWYHSTGCVSVHGQSMERGLVDFMLVTAMRLQGKRER
jgi:hypothetical protein